MGEPTGRIKNTERHIRGYLLTCLFIFGDSLFNRSCLERICKSMLSRRRKDIADAVDILLPVDEESGKFLLHPGIQNGLIYSFAGLRATRRGGEEA